MRLTAIMMLAASAIVTGAFLTSTRGYAESADDRAWVNRCVSDNRAAKVSMEVVRKYCECMNEAMDDNETRSITAFEKANPGIRKKCDAVSGWK